MPPDTERPPPTPVVVTNPSRGLSDRGLLRSIPSAGLPGFVLALSALPAWWLVSKVHDHVRPTAEQPGAPPLAAPTR